MRFSHTDSTNAWSDFHSLLEDLCIFHLNTMSYPNIGIWKCRCEPDNNKDFRHQAYILFIRPNPWQGSVIIFLNFFFFPWNFKSLFLKIQVRICLFCHILCWSRYTVRNLVTVVKSIVRFNCHSAYIGIYHPQRLILCSCVEDVN